MEAKKKEKRWLINIQYSVPQWSACAINKCTYFDETLVRILFSFLFALCLRLAGLFFAL